MKRAKLAGDGEGAGSVRASKESFLISPNPRLVATAKVFDLTLITADEHLVGLPGIRLLANR